MPEREDTEKRQKIRLQKTATARLKVVKPNRPVVDGENPDETVLSEPEDNGGKQPQTDSAATSEAAETAATSVPTEAEPAKTNTSQLNIVQQKKKELDDRIKAHNTVRLKAPITQDSDATATSTISKTKSATGSETGSETIKISNKDKESEKTSAIKSEAGNNAKKTLKVKRPAAGRTVKMGGAGKSKGTMKMPAGKQEQPDATGQPATGVAVKTPAQEAKDQPGALYTLGAIITLAACATLTFLLASQYLEYVTATP
jgi:hypothetical protein